MLVREAETECDVHPIDRDIVSYLGSVCMFAQTVRMNRKSSDECPIGKCNVRWKPKAFSERVQRSQPISQHKLKWLCVPYAFHSVLIRLSHSLDSRTETVTIARDKHEITSVCNSQNVPRQ